KRKCESLRSRAGVTANPAEPRTELKGPQDETSAQDEASIHVGPEMDPETEMFVNQAITDVDLYSSYGLTERALELLDTVLQRVPQHTGALERLLDLNVGLNNEKRTLELAAQLEKIYEDAGHKTAAERFADLRRRFERAAAQKSTTQENPAS